MGIWARMLRRFADAHAHYREATESYGELGIDDGALLIDLARGDLCLAQGDADGAARHLLSAFSALARGAQLYQQREALHGVAR